jgi:GDP-L-fucose synthase
VELTIKDLALAVGNAVGYEGSIEFDASKPDGSPRKLMDSHRLRSLGWQPTVSLADGLAHAYAHFVEQYAE